MTERTFTDGVSRECLRPMGGLPTHCAAQQKGILEDVVIATSTMRGDSDEHKKEFCLTKEIYSELLSAGYFEMPGGLPESWREWEMFKFVELYHDSFYEVIIRELENLRDVWEPCEGSHQRYGAFAAAKVSELLKSHGIVLYAAGESQSQEPPYESSGPRWYVSLTPAALEHFGRLMPPPPPDMHELICGHPDDQADRMRARGLGWTLAPPGSDPQQLHADIWGTCAEKDKTRWPHILWKRDPSKCCTTEAVPAGFAEGVAEDWHYSMLTQVSTPAFIFNSEILHRGAATQAKKAGENGSSGWGGTLSLELCTPTGWKAWEKFETCGTTKDLTSSLDWRMCEFAQLPRQHGHVIPLPNITEVKLGPAPWKNFEGKHQLHQMQREWEFSGQY